MLKTRILPAVLVAVAFFTASCSTVPVTGRSQLNIIPASTMQSMSYQQYGEFLQTHQISRDQSKIQMVQRVGANIKNSVELYFKQKGLSNQLNGYRWEFNLVESPEVNAWCMPGGKVVVYSGILPITQTEPGLAVVMGHEIAHAIAEHGSERMSQGLLTQLGGVALNEALSNKPEQTRALWMTAFGVGAQVGVMLPFSRLHESEADKLGLIFMAMAGYNPSEAVNFWQRMAATKSGGAPPEFLSTHPSDETRIKDLKAALPEAMQYYKK
ncbi:MAG: M48 family metallopeptidase [Bacteroidota bacterium]